MNWQVDGPIIFRKLDVDETKIWVWFEVWVGPYNFVSAELVAFNEVEGHDLDG